MLELLSAIDGVVWGPAMIALLLGSHIFLTIRTGFIQRRLPQAIRISWQNEKGAEGDISNFGALSTALAATIGTGSIVGVATAILAGDALICAPFAIMAADRNLTSDQKVMLVSTLATLEGAGGMVGGQQMDMQFETRDDVTVQELETMCNGKTGALMAAACRMGCICGSGSIRQFDAAGKYGLYVGLAFQIIDDILDVTSTAEQLGKPIGSDAEEHKTTFVTLMGIEKAKARAAELTELAHAQLDAFEHTEFLHALTDELLVRVQ